jgi:hypothetical protein
MTEPNKEIVLSTHKRKETGEPSNKELSTVDESAAKALKLADGSKAKEKEEQQPATDLIPVQFSRLVGEANPEYALSMRQAGELSFQRPAANRMLNTRDYTLDVKNIRTRITEVATEVLTWLNCEHGNYPTATATANAAADAALIADGCMTALYARLRTIARTFNVNPTRFTTPATFPKEVELPLPFALAIENIGVFDTEDVTPPVRIVPTYPENTTNEGRAAQTWNTSNYLSIVAIMKEQNIPFKKINIHNKTGTPWWTFVPLYNHCEYDLRCIFPPIMYTALSATIAQMFLHHTKDVPDMIYSAKADDQHHPRRMRVIHPREVPKAFFALCNFPDYTWSSLTPTL